MSIVERIITVYNDKGSKQAVKDLKKLEAKFVDAGKKIGKAFAVATVAVGAFAVKVGVDAVKGAIEDQKSQALLANALRNTTGATDEAIKAVEEYITKQQMLVAVSDTELRQSLITLTTATGDLTQAQALQNVALDTAAGTTKDLQTVSLAIAKAFNGNIGALTKLGVSIDKTIVKNKDFKGAVDALTKAYGGAAITAADTLEGRLRQLQIAYGEVLETLGYALLPVIQEFAEYIVANVLPALEKWVNTNKDELAAGLKDLGTTLFAVAKLLAGFFKVISENLGAIQIFASIFVGAKLAKGIYSIVVAISALRTALLAQAAAGVAAGSGLAFATAGISAGAAAVAVGAFAVAAGGAYIAINKLTGANQNFATVTDKASASTVQYNSHLNDLARVAGQVAAANIKNRKIINDNTKGTKELTAAEKKAAEMRAAIKKAGLDVFGIKSVSDTDPVQLEAARLNLLKQNNLEELRKIELLLKSADAQKRVNENAERYADILITLADNKITPDEIGVLAAKWGMSIDAVTNYLARFLVVKDTKVDDSEVALLAAAWGISKEAAQKYLDFFAALNDGKLSDEEIAKLQTKWNLTAKEVNQYADFVSKLDDFTISDKEITNLQDQWGLTTDQVLAYTEEIGLPVSYSGTLVDPAKAAKAGWNEANSALTAYIIQLDTAISQSAAANSAAVAAFTETQKAIENAKTASSAAGDASAKAATASLESAAANAEAIAASVQAAVATAAGDAASINAAAASAAGDAAQATAQAASAAAIAASAQAAAANAAAAAAVSATQAAAEYAAAVREAAEAAKAAAEALAGLSEAERNKVIGGTDGGAPATGGSGGDRVNPIGGDMIALASGGIVTSPTMALIGEAGPEAVIPLSRGGGFGGGITITVNNAGSVIAEADLVSSIRNALLQAQNNGQVITKSAVAI